MDNKLKDNVDDKPPFLSSWNKIYLFVIAELIILIALFYLFTEAFS